MKIFLYAYSKNCYFCLINNKKKIIIPRTNQQFQPKKKKYLKQKYIEITTNFVYYNSSQKETKSNVVLIKSTYN